MPYTVSWVVRVIEVKCVCLSYTVGRAVRVIEGDKTAGECPHMCMC